MEKIKWSYDKNFKQWHMVMLHSPFPARIIKDEYGTYELTHNHFKLIGRFKKLSSAKTVSQLLING